MVPVVSAPIAARPLSPHQSRLAPCVLDVTCPLGATSVRFIRLQISRTLQCQRELMTRRHGVDPVSNVDLVEPRPVR